LLGIRTADQLRLHPLRGPVFESWVASEVLKARLHGGRPADLFHLREDRGLEIDLIVEAGDLLFAVEAKSGATVAKDFFAPLSIFTGRVGEAMPHVQPRARLVYGGDRREMRSDVDVLPWREIHDVDW
jgi:hypothetical protein